MELIGKVEAQLESPNIKQRHHRQTELRWNSACDAIVKDFETVSEKCQRGAYYADGMIETQTKPYDLAGKKMPESPICLLSRIPNILWHLYTGEQRRETHGGHRDKGWVRTSSHLQRFSQVERAGSEHIRDGLHEFLKRRLCDSLQCKHGAKGCWSHRRWLGWNPPRLLRVQFDTFGSTK